MKQARYDATTALNNASYTNAPLMITSKAKKIAASGVWNNPGCQEA